MKRLPILLLVVALSCLIVRELQYAGDRKDWRVWSQDTLRLLTDLNVNRSQRVILQRERDSIGLFAESLKALANRQNVQIGRFRASGDSLRLLLTTATPQESLPLTLGLVETYRVALDSSLSRSSVLEAFIALRDSQIVRLTQSEALGWRSADSLAALVRRTPKHGCRKIPIVGISVPTLGIGYGIGPRGAGPVVALTIPIGGCR